MDSQNTLNRFHGRQIFVRIFGAIIILLSVTLLLQTRAAAQTTDRDVLFNKAQEAAASESWSEVRSYIQQLVALDRAALQKPGLEIGFNPETDALYNSLNLLAIAHEKAGDADATIAVTAERLEILETLASKQPENEQVLSRLDTLRVALADSYFKNRQLDDAEALYRQAAAWSKLRMDATPEAPFPIERHKRAYEGLVDIALARGNLETADQTMAYVINLQDQIIKGAGIFEQDYEKAEKSKHLLNRAAILFALENTDTVREPIEEARLIIDKLIDLPWNDNEALSLYNQAMPIERRLAHYRDTYVVIAELYADLEDIEAAAESFDKSISTSDRLSRWEDQGRTTRRTLKRMDREMQILEQAANFNLNNDRTEIAQGYLVSAYAYGTILILENRNDRDINDRHGRILATLANTNHPDYSWKRAADFWKSLNDHGLLKPDSQALYDEIQRVAAAEALQPSE